MIISNNMPPTKDVKIISINALYMLTEVISIM